MCKLSIVACFAKVLYFVKQLPGQNDSTQGIKQKAIRGQSLDDVSSWLPFFRKL